MLLKHDYFNRGYDYVRFVNWSCSCYFPSNHLLEIHVLLFCKHRYKSRFLSIHSPAYMYKKYSSMIYSNRLLTLHLKMATRLVVAGKWTDIRYHCKFVCMNKIKLIQSNDIFEHYTMLRYDKSIFSGFIQMMQFVEKQHNLTLKALILYAMHFLRLWYSREHREKWMHAVQNLIYRNLRIDSLQMIVVK